MEVASIVIENSLLKNRIRLTSEIIAYSTDLWAPLRIRTLDAFLAIVRGT
jgi:hypothetical protein